MRLAITGAAGFVGRSLVRHLQRTGFSGEVRLIDRSFEGEQPFEALAIDLTEPEGIERALEGVDRVIHLAAIPGAAAQQDPHASRTVNVDIALALLERVQGRRLVYASSIAVFGGELPACVDEATVPNPVSVSGTHKRMVELAFADAVRRGTVTGFALRLPGIVARPSADKGFGSAFLSDLFHAARDARAYTLPVAPEATTWLMSAQTCAANLLHAASSPESEAEAVNLPALTVRLENLVAGLGRVCDVSGITYREDLCRRRTFGSYPPLDRRRAEAMGFMSDGDVRSLVDSVLSQLEIERPLR